MKESMKKLASLLTNLCPPVEIALTKWQLTCYMHETFFRSEIVGCNEYFLSGLVIRLTIKFQNDITVQFGLKAKQATQSLHITAIQDEFYNNKASNQRYIQYFC